MAATAMTPVVRSPSANTSSTAALATASWRIGRRREPTRSDHQPLAMRPPAPAIWATATKHPAAPGDQPCSRTRYSSENAEIANCGSTSSALAACTRGSTAVR